MGDAAKECGNYMQTNELDIQIEEYLEGRMAAHERVQFEERMKTDAELRRQVETTSDSIKMVRQALVRVEPSEDFEEKVTSKIVSITQSNPNLRPAKAPACKLSANDPDAKLILDPVAEQERQRLVILAVVAGLLFVAAATVIIWAILGAR
jgi:anti-sigma-K factor RskA